MGQCFKGIELENCCFMRDHIMLVYEFSFPKVTTVPQHRICSWASWFPLLCAVHILKYTCEMK